MTRAVHGTRTDEPDVSVDPYRRGMPELCRFFGIVIQMYVDDHTPAHFHARAAGQEVAIEIETLAILGRGRLSPRAHALVVEWAAIHADELMLDWGLAQSGLPLRRIAPLR
jgi:hypothetical protein